MWGGGSGLTEEEEEGGRSGGGRGRARLLRLVCVSLTSSLSTSKDEFSVTPTCWKDMNPELLRILPNFPYFNSYFMHLSHFHVSVCSTWDFFVLTTHDVLKLTTAASLSLR